jgi:hypothetical protein
VSDHVTDDSADDLSRLPAHPGPPAAGTVLLRPLPRRPGRVLPVLLTVLAGGWAVGTVTVLVGGAWAVEQVLVIEGLAMPPWGWPLLHAVAALLVAVPSLLLAMLPAQASLRAVGRTWLAGSVLLALLGSVRAVPVQHTSGYALLLAAVATLAAVLLPRLLPAAGLSSAPADRLRRPG